MMLIEFSKMYRIERNYVQQFPNSRIDDIELQDVGIGGIYPLPTKNGIQIITPIYHTCFIKDRQEAAGMERITLTWQDPKRPLMIVELINSDMHTYLLSQYQKGLEYQSIFPMIHATNRQSAYRTDVEIDVPHNMFRYVVDDLQCEYDPELGSIYIITDYSCYMSLTGDKKTPLDSVYSELISKGVYELVAEVHSNKL